MRLLCANSNIDSWLQFATANRSALISAFYCFLVLNVEWQWFYQIWERWKTCAASISLNLCTVYLVWQTTNDCLGTGACVAICGTCTYVWQSFYESFFDSFFPSSSSVSFNEELLNKYDMNWCVLGTACLLACMRPCVYMNFPFRLQFHSCL